MITTIARTGWLVRGVHLTIVILLLIPIGTARAETDCEAVQRWHAEHLEITEELGEDEIILSEEWERLSFVEHDPVISDALMNGFISEPPVHKNEIKVTSRSRRIAHQITQRLNKINEEFFEELLEIHNCSTGG